MQHAVVGLIPQVHGSRRSLASCCTWPALQAQCTMEDKAAVSDARVARAVHEAVLALVVQHEALKQATDMLFGCARRCEHGPDAVAACAAYAVEQKNNSLVSLGCMHAAAHGIGTAARGLVTASAACRAGFGASAYKSKCVQLCIRGKCICPKEGSREHARAVTCMHPYPPHPRPPSCLHPP